MKAQSWPDPTEAFDFTDFSEVTIWCTVAPSVAYTIEGGPTAAAMDTQAAVNNTAAGIATDTEISAVGRYDLPGGGYIALTGGTGGTFLTSAK